MSYCVNVFRVDSCHNWAPFVLVVVIALFMVTTFIFFFQKFTHFCGQMCGLGLISVGFTFTFIPSLYQVYAKRSQANCILVME